MSRIIGASIHITGIIQGVGFRPFVYSLAKRLKLKGWVRNTSAGVDIEVDGTPKALEEFVEALECEHPRLATIDSIHINNRPPNGFDDFEIIQSEPIADAFQPISPDVSICDDCLRELYDPTDRRYRYPFINCTNCGPRFTIITDIPYDRPNTTMAPFEMCSDCAAEYQDPLDRRFHAQPVACPVCGPHLWLEYQDVSQTFLGPEGTESAIAQTRELLKDGTIVAIKGLGGFHLACDGTNPEAVAKLRKRKLRVDKPFALMMYDIDTVERNCLLNQKEKDLMLTKERPILLLWRRPESNISRQVAPNQKTLGVMLPYTPLHYILLEPEDGFPEALVMTSGNLSEEPIATQNRDAYDRLGALSDAFLMHNRDIHTRCDDSVIRIVAMPDLKSIYNNQPRSPKSDLANYKIYPLRRSRGYSPFPIHLPWETIPLLSTGPELKNTFCLTQGRYAFLSHHIGDMENYETLKSFQEGVDHFETLFRIHPKAIVYDLHPNYLATRYALERSERESIPAVGVQHHHAHIAACMAEHGIIGDHPMIGVSFDGTGYGDDGHIWGGEFLFADYKKYQRFAHLTYVPLPGGDKAIQEPWRIALSWLHYLGLDWEEDLYPVKHASHHLPSYMDISSLEIIRRQISKEINAPLTSSMGRLFDAVASLVGVRQEINYEAQAAIELEALVDPNETGSYSFTLDQNQSSTLVPMNIDPSPTFRTILNDLQHNVSIPVIAARFHNGLSKMVAGVCLRMRREFGTNEVVLSGGVWQNTILLTLTMNRLSQEGFQVYIHNIVPSNDGGLALGQAAIGTQTIADHP